MCEESKEIAKVVISWADIQQFINTKLKLGGIDPNKEMTKWCLWENDAVSFCYEQATDAPLTAKGQEELSLTKRPAYLKGR